MEALPEWAVQRWAVQQCAVHQQEAKRCAPYRVSTKKWEEWGLTGKTLYPSIKAEHGSWTLNAHLWHKISILCFHKNQNSQVFVIEFHINGHIGLPKT